MGHGPLVAAAPQAVRITVTEGSDDAQTDDAEKDAEQAVLGELAALSVGEDSIILGDPDIDALSVGSDSKAEV